MCIRDRLSSAWIIKQVSCMLIRIMSVITTNVYCISQNTQQPRPWRSHRVFTWDESRQRPLQVFAPILWSALKLDTIVPVGVNPLRGSVIIFAPARCCYMTSYLTLCLLIRCDNFIAWILPELWKRYSLWAIVGCKLYKVCFCSPIFCQKSEVIR